MPNNFLRDLARRRSAYTGESFTRALKALRALPDTGTPIPIANGDQALLEMEVVDQINRFDVSDASGWVPGEEPLGIAWLTPHADRLDFGVRERFLPSLLFALLPTYTERHGEPGGVCGLRYRILPRAVELYRLGLSGSIRLCGVSKIQWWQAVNTMVADIRDAGLGINTAIWLHYPDRLHPAEDECARLYCPGYRTNPLQLDSDMATVASDFMRRHHVFTAGPTINGFRLWMDTRLKLEWADGPLHPQVVELLTDPACGMSATFEEGTCGDCGAECGRTARLRAANGTVIELRREKLGWGRKRADHAREVLRRRVHRLKLHEGTTGLIEQPPQADCSRRPGAGRSTAAASTPPKPVWLGERLANSTKFLDTATGDQPSKVRLAKAWNAFTTAGFVCTVLAEYSFHARDNYEVGFAFACHASRTLAKEISGGTFLTDHGRTVDTTTVTPQQLDHALQSARIELFTSNDHDIDRIASAMITLTAHLGSLLDQIVRDKQAESSHRRIAKELAPYAREIWAHFGGDGGGW